MAGDFNFPLFIALYSLRRKECKNVERIGGGSCRDSDGKRQKRGQ